ncbi:MAG: bacitracin resistance protein BacA [Pseudobacteriovorax sp.]|nr:bacitracin resistance protein BacA [Pseudobacteriovorax sp.]
MDKTFFRAADDDLFVPKQGPQGASPPLVFDKIGEDAIRMMIRDFYSRLLVSSISGMFKRDFDVAVDRSASFFIGLLGGPPLFHQKFGHPRMRARHLPFRITAEFRQVWLDCFHQTLDENQYGMSDQEVSELRAFLQSFSSWMVNTRD